MCLGTHQSILQDRCGLPFWTILVNNMERCKLLSKVAAHQYEQGITKSFDFLVKYGTHSGLKKLRKEDYY